MLGLSELTEFDVDAKVSEDFLTPLERCIRGQPVQRTWSLYESPDDRFFAGVWEADPGCWRISYTEQEYFRILSGQSILRDANGAECRLRAGTELLIPAGFEGEWDVHETTRKVYVIYQP